MNRPVMVDDSKVFRVRAERSGLFLPEFEVWGEVEAGETLARSLTRRAVWFTRQSRARRRVASWLFVSTPWSTPGRWSPGGDAVSVIFSIDAPYRGRYELHRLTYGSGGPSVAIVAGLHGNELNSIHAVNLLNKMLRFSAPRARFTCFPWSIPSVLIEAQKRWPYDDQDINHTFLAIPTGQ